MSDGAHPLPSAAAAAAATVEGPMKQDPKIIRVDPGEVTEMESMCMRCEQNGRTRLMVTSIPHFREIIVSSFECEHCGERNTEVQFGGKFGDKKVRYELAVSTAADLNRQVVKSEWGTIKIPELELEIPPQTQRGSLTTVEGVLDDTIDGLQLQQPLRLAMEPELHAKIEEFCDKLRKLKESNGPFTLVLDDPAGNSYIEGIYDYYHPTIDPKLRRFETVRTEIDWQMLGLDIGYNTQHRTKEQERALDQGELDGEIFEIQTSCSACGKAGVQRVHQCDIPYFKDTVIMAFKCDYCGFKSNEVKSGGAVPAKGRRVTLKVLNEADMRRDVLKSDTARLMIPEIQLELEPGTLGGFFTTVEGVLTSVQEQLSGLGQVSFEVGDSAGAEVPGVKGATSMAAFCNELTKLAEGNTPFTLILDDPLAHVYIQNPRAHLPEPDNVDPQLTIEDYERTWDEDEELGFHQMNVE